MEKAEEKISEPPASVPDENQPTKISSLKCKFQQFICHFCGIKFDEKTHLRQHIGHKHLPKDEKCPDCDVMTNSISIKSHQQIHRKKHICEKCGRLFQTAKRLAAHMEKLCLSKTREALEQDPEFLAKKKFKCLICMYRGPNERALNKHIQRVHRAKNMEKEKTCEICDKKFTKLAYIYHIRTHGRIQCKICHKSLSTGSGFFKQHMANHKKEEEEPSDPKSFEKALGPDGIFRCYGESCDYQTHKKRLFVRHFQNVHGPKLLKCDFPGCDSGLMSEKQLWRHKNSHKRKDCQKCGAIFNELRDLNRHIANNVCKDIDKDTVEPNSQPIHDLKCPKCDYTTYQSNSLTRHRLLNHATIVGKCTFPGCQNDEMMTKLKLAIHLRRHTEIKKSRKKHTCEYCGLVLSSSANLDKHLESCEDKVDGNENNQVNKSEIKEMIDESEENDSFDDQETRDGFRNDPKSSEESNVTKIKVEPETESTSFDNSQSEDFIASQINIKLEPEVELHEIIDGKALKVEAFDSEEDIFDGNNELETSENPLRDFDESVATFERDYPIKCTQCDFRTEKKKYLTNHMATKHDPNPTKCPHCDKIVSRALFNKHLATHERKFECYTCNRNFATNWKLKDHNLKHHPELIDGDSSTLIGHLEDILGDALTIPNYKNSDETSSENGDEEPVVKEEHACPKCTYKSTNIHEFRCHVLDHKKIRSNSQQFSCNQCYYITPRKKNLDYHIIMVHDPATVECHVCQKQINKRRLNKHMKIHTLEFSCKICAKRTSTRWNLKVHINKMHPNRQDLIDEITDESKAIKEGKLKPPPVIMQCDHCEYTTEDKRNFTNHFWRMHSITKWNCHYCGKYVSWIDSKRHLATHENPPTKTSEFMCEKCSKVFAQKRSLEVHMLSCNGKIRSQVSNQFKCELCNFATGSKKSLRNHKYMVHAPKDCECPYCHKMMTKARFSGHMSWHENRLTCTLCQKSNFASRWHLKVHILKVHPGNEQLMQDEGLLKDMGPKEPQKLACPECGKEVRKSRLSSHMLIHNKKVQCEFEGCVKMFPHKYAQKAHMKRSHKVTIKEEIVDSGDAK